MMPLTLMTDASKADQFLGELKTLCERYAITAGVFGWCVGSDWRAAVFGERGAKAGLLVELREEVDKQVRPSPVLTEPAPPSGVRRSS